MTERLIEGPDDLAEGTAFLCAREPRFARAVEVAGHPPLRRRPGGFAGLMRIVVGQQLSVAAADSIWARLESLGCETAADLSSRTEVELRACGLSAPKVRTARAVAAAEPDWGYLRTAPPEDAAAALTALPGIGPWTAQIYLMFCVGRADVFAPADLALQEAARMLFDLPERPAPKALSAMAEDWAPWRAVAARILWAYYGAAKGREGIGA